MLLVVRLREVLAVARQGGLLPRGTLRRLALLGGTVSAVGEMFGYLVGDTTGRRAADDGVRAAQGPVRRAWGAGSGMRLGLLGCGSAAYWLHLRALRGIPGATLVAAADPDPAARARFASASGVTTYERAEDLLGRSDIEAVLICAPTNLHASLACAVASAGKHFYLEKPIATLVQDARDVVAAADRPGLTSAIGFNRRHHPLFEQARTLLNDGVIGRVHAVQTTFCEPSPPDGMPSWKRRRATGGGALLDLASHHIDLVRWMLATEVAGSPSPSRPRPPSRTGHGSS